MDREDMVGVRHPNHWVRKSKVKQPQGAKVGSAPEALLPEGVGGGEVCQTASSAAAGAPSARRGGLRLVQTGPGVPHGLLWQRQALAGGLLAQGPAETCLPR